MQQHKVVSLEEWLAARKSLLAKEKELTRARDQVNEARQSLPWVKVQKQYVFDTPDGNKTLTNLFGRNSQLIIHHFMFGPDWDAGCPSCSLVADHAEGAIVHLQNHDVSYVRVSRAPLAKIEAYRKRMGWNATWVSSYGSDFNSDYGVSFTASELESGAITYNYKTVTDKAYHSEEMHGISVFYKDEKGDVFHTYSSYARGYEETIGVFMYLDRTPKGRNETTIMDWVRRHDEYDNASNNHSCCHE